MEAGLIKRILLKMQAGLMKDENNHSLHVMDAPACPNCVIAFVT